ncbi:hypothetical protein [Streptomyces sp. E5N91]|uniref:hypothetical protein n=1 Tax=Streptomyces sp. E5N91 TaxID=1851996 RepID=UPI0031BA077A
MARCRAEGVSVHAALCTAAGTVFHRASRTWVRVLSPVDLRRATGLPDAVAHRLAGARTVPLHVTLFAELCAPLGRVDARIPRDRVPCDQASVSVRDRNRVRVRYRVPSCCPRRNSS